jgi:membrane fusion protein, macrolide-specific efflux system
MRYAMSSKTRRIGIIALILIVLLGGSGLLARHFLFAKEVPSYITASAAAMDIEERVLASGTLNAFKTVDVGAQVSGQLKKLHVALGDRVKKGQLLAEIDPVLQRNALRDAEATLENVRAQKLSKQALLKQYVLALKRQNELITRDATAHADLESAQAQLDGTRADLAALDAQISKAAIAVDSAKANLDYTQIVAPMDGVVLTIATQEGQTVVSTQSATTILTLADLGTITVKAKISEADVLRVKPGLTSYFTLLGDADTRYTSRLRTVEPASTATTTASAGNSAASSSTSTAAVYYNGLFEVPNPDGKLRAAMTAQVTIVINGAKQALCIPSSALEQRSKDGRATVRLLRGTTPEIRAIRVGISDNVQVQVLEGLRAGDKVVIGDSASVPVNAAGSGHPGPPKGRR